MKTRAAWAAVVVCGLVLGARTCTAQADSPMTLDVVVTDKAEKPVADLKTEDFKVLDNKEERRVNSVRLVTGGDEKTDPPVTVYLVVDMVNAMSEDISNDTVLKQFLVQAGPRLAVPTSLIFFGNTSLRFQREPTRDPKILLANLASVGGANQSILKVGVGQQLADWREKSLEALNHIAVKLNDVPGRKLVIWISPGWGPGYGAVHKTKKELDALFAYIVGISTALRQARVTIFSVAPHGADPIFGPDLNTSYKRFWKGVESEKQEEDGDLMLQVIAAQSGGRVQYGSNNIAGLIDQCISDAQAFYEVTYSAPHARQANEYHAVQVVVDKPGLTTRERTGYYAQP